MTEQTNGLSVALGIQRAMHRRGMSARATSLAAGLSESYVSKIITGTCEPSVRAYGKIAQVLQMNTHEVWLLTVAESLS